MRRRAVLVLATTALLVVLTGLWATLRVGAWLAAPALRNVPLPETPMHLTAVRFASGSGSTLAAWWAVPTAPRAAVVLLHGIRSTRLDVVAKAERLWRAGYAVLLPDLQAHGESQGRAITFGALESEDALAAVSFARGALPGRPVAGLGTSLGGAAFALAAPRLEVEALVLESVYPTIEEAVRNRIAARLGPLAWGLSPLLLAQLRPRLGVQPARLRPIDHLAQLGCPVLIASGQRDRHTTPAETRRMFAATRPPREIWLVQGAAHEDLYRAAPGEWAATVLGFFARYLGEPGAPPAAGCFASSNSSTPCSPKWRRTSW